MPSPATRHHAEWLSLLEISGPFLSMPVLLKAFPQGLDEFPSEEARSLRADYEFWQEDPHNPTVFTAWVRLVLESMLGYSERVLLTGQAIPAGWKAEFPEHEETLRPDMMLVEPGTHTPHLLIQVYPPGQALDRGVSGSRWQASVITRMMELLHATEVRLGLATNGEQWMLVDAPRGETTGFTTWTAGLWFDEPLTLRAFRSLMGVGRFFGVAPDQTLESLLAESAEDQQEITDQLGLQVRHAVEILIQMIDRADQDSGGKLLGGAQGLAPVSPDLLYEAALTVMMRLVFMLSAEERKLLPLDDSLYADYYAVSTLRAQLRELADQQGEEVLERRYDAWSRLLAAFRAVYGGIRHERLTLPPYGGSLFNPDKYPFLEGRALTPPSSLAPLSEQERGTMPLPVNNRTVLHLLDALQMLQVSGEARRLSFRALDVEQIGHVYEGLLDHHAVRASEVMVGLRGVKRQEPEVALSALEQAAQKKETEFLAWLKDATGRGLSALKNALKRELLPDDADFANRLRIAAGNDERLLERLAPFAELLRRDDFGFPVVILPGSVYVTEGTARRATGTHYTPRSLTEPVVQHTLEPLVYAGPAEGWPREQWRLRSPAELLALKVCDMAMGSGGFLVQVIRYLAERLVEAWALSPDDLEEGAAGFPVSSLASEEDRLTYARRLVAERCVYGVDKNLLAVEIAKLSLWLATMAKDLPFTFLDHALKCGDSLVGAGEADFKGWARGWGAAEATLFDEQLAQQLETARQKRRSLESFVVRDVQDAERKAGLLQEAETAMAKIKRGADLLTGTRLLGLKPKEVEDLQHNLLLAYMAGELDGEFDAAKYPEAARALAAARKEHTFHWEFEFPEVFEKCGFTAFLGNPPFIGGQHISSNLGVYYLDYVKTTWNHARGSADICAYFFLRAQELLRSKGTLGLIATNTISQGDTREVGLDFIVKNSGYIYHAIASTSWPGSGASVSVSIVHMYKGTYRGTVYLNGRVEKSISTLLDIGLELGLPNRLEKNSGISFQGSIPLGKGFVLTNQKAKQILATEAKYHEVIFPYLNGEDLNSRPDQSPSRWVINFGERTLVES
ncbi:MAG: hypothetical protein JW987_11700, partial [Anaerolineaceae bacterium]|nr:hypothetical protein [Anaerolineaceae bacterium]